MGDEKTGIYPLTHILAQKNEISFDLAEFIKYIISYGNQPA